MLCTNKHNKKILFYSLQAFKTNWGIRLAPVSPISCGSLIIQGRPHRHFDPLRLSRDVAWLPNISNGHNAGNETLKPVRPTQLVQIFPARLLRTEAVIEFKQRLQIVFVCSNILHIASSRIRRDKNRCDCIKLQLKVPRICIF